MIITGHRGALGTEPENTLRSFRRAVADGCDEIELDLRVTADGELVIMHDATVDRTTSGSGEIAAMSYDEVRSLDAGLGEVVPTWAETVTEIGIRFQAEVKAVEAIPLLVESLRADPSLAARTLVTSFHPEILLAVRRAMPTASTGRIFGRTPAISDVLLLTKEADAGTALCGIAGLTADGVAELQATGLEVTAWPVPDQDTLARAAELGVNGITTDNPHLLRRVA